MKPILTFVVVTVVHLDALSGVLERGDWLVSTVEHASLGLGTEVEALAVETVSYDADSAAFLQSRSLVDKLSVQVDVLVGDEREVRHVVS